MKKLKVVISGGGTGGHIFPAIAIADELKRRCSDADILFVGAKGRMEMERVPKAGYAIKGLWISGFQRRFTLENFSFPFKLISSMVKARRILREFKPDVVIGVGGYASGPTLRAAVAMHIPTLIQEQNSFPGVTNKILASKVDCICTGYDSMQKWFPIEKTSYTGNPLRNNVVNIDGKKDEAAEFFGFNTRKPVVLIVGGSQGALGINKGILAGLKNIQEADVQVIWQTGKTYFSTAKKAVINMGLQYNVHVIDFIDRMDMAYAVADVVISRAGAMSISELSIVGKPVIFVPLPTAAEDHQTKNAQRLVDAQAALMVKNLETEEKLVPMVLNLLDNAELLREMSTNIATFARPDAAKDIVDNILKIVK